MFNAHLQMTRYEMEQNNKEVKMQIKVTDAIQAGTYANNLIVHMNREEFVLDFINLVPPGATLNARVTITPGNLKRMMEIVQGSLVKFEKEFGALPGTQLGAPPAELVQ